MQTDPGSTPDDSDPVTQVDRAKVRMLLLRIQFTDEPPTAVAWSRRGKVTEEEVARLLSGRTPDRVLQMCWCRVVRLTDLLHRFHLTELPDALPLSLCRLASSSTPPKSFRSFLEKPLTERPTFKDAVERFVLPSLPYSFSFAWYQLCKEVSRRETREFWAMREEFKSRAGRLNQLHLGEELDLFACTPALGIRSPFDLLEWLICNDDRLLKQPKYEALDDPYKEMECSSFQIGSFEEQALALREVLLMGQLILISFQGKKRRLKDLKVPATPREVSEQVDVLIENVRQFVLRRGVSKATDSIDSESEEVKNAGLLRKELRLAGNRGGSLAEEGSNSMNKGEIVESDGSTDEDGSHKGREREINELLLGPDGVRIKEIVRDSSLSSEQRYVQILKVDRRFAGWKSGQIGQLLNLTDSAVRKLKFWKTLRKRAEEAD